MTSSFPSPLRRWLAANYGWLGAIALTAVFFGVNLYLQIAKWQSFHVTAFDYANLTAILDEILNLKFRFLDPTHIYGAALSQVYVAYVLIYAIAPSVYTPMVWTAALFASTIALTYVAGRTLFSRSRWPLVFAFLIAVNPVLIVSSLAGFRQNATVLPAVLLAFVAYQQRRRVWFIAAVALVCASQANIIPGMLLLGLWLWWRGPERLFGRAMAGVAALWLVANVAIVAVVFAATGIAPPDSMGHLGELGGTPSGVLRTLLTDPAQVLTHVFYTKNVTLLLPLLALLGLPLLAPVWLLAALPEFAYMALSTFGYVNTEARTSWAVSLGHPVFSFFNTGMIIVLPFCIIAALQGAVRVRDWWAARRPPGPWINNATVVVVVALGLVMLRYLTPTAFGPVPLAKGADFADVRVTAHHRLLRSTLDELDPARRYLMQFGFYFYAPHIPHRTLLNEQFNREQDFDFVLLDRHDPCPITSRDACRRLRAELLGDARYEVERETDGIVILRKKTAAAPD